MTTITVPKLQELLSGAIPAIAVSFADAVSDDELKLAKEDGLDVAELRIDRYGSTEPDHVVAQARQFRDFPTIATIRVEDEGGVWRGTDEERLELFRAVLPEVDAIDIELRSRAILPAVVDEARRLGKLVIISNHNFDATPSGDALLEMAQEAKAVGADYVKLSAMAQGPDDVRTLAAFTLANADLGLIVIAMGEHGTTSRVFFPALGSRLTYAYANAYPVSGQLTFGETFHELRRFYPAFNQKKVIDLQILEHA